jgi:hypothetical protein
MSADFDLLEEVEPIAPPVRRKRLLPEYSRKGVSGIPWDGFADSLELVLDHDRGEWAILYAMFRGESYPVVVSPKHAKKYADVPLHLVMSLQGEFYARGSFPRPGSKRKIRRYLHQEICNVPDNCPLDVEVHHQTRMTLDNREGNLEVVIKRLNNLLRGDVGTGTSKYIGVSYRRGFKNLKGVWSTRRKPYFAECKFGGVRYNLQYHETEEEAAQAYDAKILWLLAEQKGFVGGILPLTQVNRLLNFKRSTEELKRIFRSSLRLHRARTRKKPHRTPEPAAEMREDIPF